MLKLEVQIHRGINLVAKDDGKTSDPFVKLKINEQKTKTTNYVKKNLNPEWNENFKVDVACGEVVTFEVFDKNRVQSDVHIGTQSVVLDESFLNKFFSDGQTIPSGSHILMKLPLENAEKQGEIEVGFKLLEDVPVATLSTSSEIDKTRTQSQSKDGASFDIQIISAEGLATKAKTGTADPVCKLKTKTAEVKTARVPKTLSPQWNETFRNVRVDSTAGIEFLVSDENKIVMGRVTLPFSALSDVFTSTTQVVKELKLAGSNAGSNSILKVGFAVSGSAAAAAAALSPEYALIQVRVIRGIELMAADSNGLSDPFFKIKVDGNPIFKSSIIKRNLNPVWNQACHVEFKDDFSINLYDYDEFSSDEKLGYVTVSVEDIATAFTAGHEIIKVLPLVGCTSGKVEVGVLGLRAPKAPPKPSVGRSLLIQRRAKMIDRIPVMVMFGCVMAAFILGYFGMYLIALFAAVGYVVASIALEDKKEKEENLKKEQTLWTEHFLMHPNLEPVEWMNQMVAHAWSEHRNFLDKYATDLLSTTIAKFVPPQQDICVNKVAMGEVPPVLDAFKVSPCDNVLRLDCNFKWLSKMSITISAKKIPVSMDNMSILCLARVEAKHIPEKPFISEISMSLLEKPIVRFDLKPLKGMDLMGVPGLPSYIRDTIIDQMVGGMMVHPNKFTYNMITQAPAPVVSLRESVVISSK